MTARRAGAALARLASIALIASLAYVLAWALAEAAPGGAGERAARAAGTLPSDDAAAAPVRAALIARAEQRFMLAGGGPARVARAAGRFATGDLGASWRDGGPVAARLGRAAGQTARLVLPALVLALVGGVVAGAAARGGAAGHALAAVTALGVAAPPAWLAQLALGAGAPAGSALAAALVLALAPAATIAAHVRAAVAGFLASPLALAARARGAGEARLAWVHGLRLALPALAPLATVIVGYLLGVSAVVERGFALPGLGRLALDAAAAGDVPVLAAIAALVAGAVALAAVAAEWLARWADPRLGGA